MPQKTRPRTPPEPLDIKNIRGDNGAEVQPFSVNVEGEEKSSAQVVLPQEE